MSALTAGLFSDGLRRLRFFWFGLSVEGGLELLELFMLRRRYSSAMRASNLTIVSYTPVPQVPS